MKSLGLCSEGVFTGVDGEFTGSGAIGIIAIVHEDLDALRGGLNDDGGFASGALLLNIDDEVDDFVLIGGTGGLLEIGLEKLLGLCQAIGSIIGLAGVVEECHGAEDLVDLLEDRGGLQVVAVFKVLTALLKALASLFFGEISDRRRGRKE